MGPTAQREAGAEDCGVAPCDEFEMVGCREFESEGVEKSIELMVQVSGAPMLPCGRSGAIRPCKERKGEGDGRRLLFPAPSAASSAANTYDT